MLGCLISLLIFGILLAIVYYVLKLVADMFLPLPAKIWQLIGILFGLLVLVQALACLGIISESAWIGPRLVR